MSDAMTKTAEDRTIETRATENRAVQNRVWATPPVDVFENDDAFLVRTDLPGVTRDGVDIRFEQDTLRIEATRDLADAGWNYDFRRAFKLSGIDESKISAEMKEGVLSLTLPKAERVKPRQIPVSVG